MFYLLAEVPKMVPGAAPALARAGAGGFLAHVVTFICFLNTEGSWQTAKVD